MTASNEEKLDAILDAIKSLEARVTRIEAGSEGAPSVQKVTASAVKKLSIKEFLLERPPTTDIQRNLAIGYFLEMYAGMSSFPRAVIPNSYGDGKGPAPSNIGVNIK